MIPIRTTNIISLVGIFSFCRLILSSKLRYSLNTALRNNLDWLERQDKLSQRNVYILQSAVLIETLQRDYAYSIVDYARHEILGINDAMAELDIAVLLSDNLTIKGKFELAAQKIDDQPFYHRLWIKNKALRTFFDEARSERELLPYLAILLAEVSTLSETQKITILGRIKGAQLTKSWELNAELSGSEEYKIKVHRGLYYAMYEMAKWTLAQYKLDVQRQVLTKKESLTYVPELKSILQFILNPKDDAEKTVRIRKAPTIDSPDKETRPLLSPETLSFFALQFLLGHELAHCVFEVGDVPNHTGDTIAATKFRINELHESQSIWGNSVISPKLLTFWQTEFQSDHLALSLLLEIAAKQGWPSKEIHFASAWLFNMMVIIEEYAHLALNMQFSSNHPPARVRLNVINHIFNQIDDPFGLHRLRDECLKALDVM